MNTQESTERIKSDWQKVINYFLRGLLVLLPFAITAGIIYWIIQTIGKMMSDNQLSGKETVFYALGCLALILATGYFTRGVVARQILDFVEGIIERAPGLKFIFGTTRDMTEAFVGDKKKFTEPVLIKYGAGLYRIGFVTQHDMALIGHPEYLAVYVPSSYAISGDLYITLGENLKPMDHDGGQIMKFILSGGVANIDKTDK